MELAFKNLRIVLNPDDEHKLVICAKDREVLWPDERYVVNCLSADEAKKLQRWLNCCLD